MRASNKKSPDGLLVGLSGRVKVRQTDLIGGTVV